MLTVLESEYGEEEPELLEKAKRFFEGNEQGLLDKLSDVHFSKEDGFRCLVHNDAWYNNFMFK